MHSVYLIQCGLAKLSWLQMQPFAWWAAVAQTAPSLPHVVNMLIVRRAVGPLDGLPAGGGAHGAGPAAESGAHGACGEPAATQRGAAGARPHTQGFE